MNNKIFRKISGTTKFEQNKKIRLSISKPDNKLNNSHNETNNKINGFQFNLGSRRIRQKKIRIITDPGKENTNINNIQNNKTSILIAVETLLSSLNNNELKHIRYLIDKKLND
jgi:hypothetical protein